MNNFFDSVESCVTDLRLGRPVILVDSIERENEADFVLSGLKASQSRLNFLLTHGRGILCVSVSEKKATSLGLKKMAENTDRFQTPFTVSVDARTAFSGVSVNDRLKTIRLLASINSKPRDFVVPGHVFPLVSKPFGVIERQGHTEGSLDLVQMATNSQDVAVIIEIMDKKGSMAKKPFIFGLKKKFGIKIVSIQQVLDYRLLHETFLQKIASPFLPTEFGDFKLHGFKDKVFGKEFVALVKDKVKGKKNVLLRLHSACFTGDVLFSKRCDCHAQLVESMKLISRKGGILVYALEQEGRGIGLLNKLKAYELQEKGLDTVQANTALGFKADQRNYAMQAQVIKALKVKSIKLLSNNPKKIAELKKFGVKVSGVISLKISPTNYTKNYLLAKKTKLAHLL